jgi:hypothetical protein
MLRYLPWPNYFVHIHDAIPCTLSVHQAHFSKHYTAAQ